MVLVSRALSLPTTLGFFSASSCSTPILSLTYPMVFCFSCWEYDSWGYSLAFSEGAASSHFIGDLKYFAFQNVLDQPSGRIPVLLFAICESRGFGM